MGKHSDFDIAKLPNPYNLNIFKRERVLNVFAVRFRILLQL